MKSTVGNTIWISIAATVLLLVCATGMAFAHREYIAPRELRSFDQFLDSHRAIDRELSRHPRLIDDPVWVKAHPELHVYLASHPATRQDLKRQPGYFMAREHRYDRRHH